LRLLSQLNQIKDETIYLITEHAKLKKQVAELEGKLYPGFDVSFVEKTSSWIGDRLQLIKTYGSGKVFRCPLDGKYYVPPLEDMQKIIAWDWVDAKEYIREIYDCENFAFSFKARVDRLFHLNNVALVIDWSGLHAYNMFVTSDGEVFILEPQTDEYWSVREHDYQSPFNLESAVVLI